MYETYSAHAHFNFITLDAVVTIIYQLFIFMNKQTSSEAIQNMMYVLKNKTIYKYNNKFISSFV